VAAFCAGDRILAEMVQERVADQFPLIQIIFYYKNPHSNNPVPDYIPRLQTHLQIGFLPMRYATAGVVSTRGN